MRGQGRLFRRKHSASWWIAYYHPGRGDPGERADHERAEGAGVPARAAARRGHASLRVSAGAAAAVRGPLRAAARRLRAQGKPLAARVQAHPSRRGVRGGSRAHHHHGADRSVRGRAGRERRGRRDRQPRARGTPPRVPHRGAQAAAAHHAGGDAAAGGQRARGLHRSTGAGRAGRGRCGRVRLPHVFPAQQRARRRLAVVQARARPVGHGGGRQRAPPRRRDEEQEAAGAPAHGRPARARGPPLDAARARVPLRFPPRGTPARPFRRPVECGVPRRGAAANALPRSAALRRAQLPQGPRRGEGHPAHRRMEDHEACSSATTCSTSATWPTRASASPPSSQRRPRRPPTVVPLEPSHRTRGAREHGQQTDIRYADTTPRSAAVAGNSGKS
jgi:hypothetical protein